MELYSSPDGAVRLPVRFDGETAWATQAQMADLFGVDRDTVGVHLRNAFNEGEVDREATTEEISVVRREGSRDVTRSVLHYDLDAIISVGYRIHSPRGVHFRRWATGVLRQKILDQNATRLGRMDQMTELLVTSSDEQLASIGRIMRRHTGDLDRLADYDRGSLSAPAETPATQRVNIDDVERIVAELRNRYPADERLGVAKDDSIHGVLSQIDQTFMGEELYSSVEEEGRESALHGRKGPPVR